MQPTGVRRRALLALSAAWRPWSARSCRGPRSSAGPFSEQARGIDGWEGKAAVVGGAVMVWPVPVWSRIPPGDRAVAVPVPRSAAWSLGVGIYTGLTAREQLLDAARRSCRAPRSSARWTAACSSSRSASGLRRHRRAAPRGSSRRWSSIGVPRQAPPPASGAGLRGWAKRPAGPAPGPTPRAGAPVIRRRRRARRDPRHEHRGTRARHGGRRVVDVTDLVRAFCVDRRPATVW